MMQLKSSLTDRYQTTIPSAVRQQLGLDKRDGLQFTITKAGLVVLSRAEPEVEADPVLEPFLAFLERDMKAAPQRLQAISVSLSQRARELVAGVDVDLDAPLDPDEE